LIIFTEELLQEVEATGPEALVGGEPLVSGGKGGRIEPAEMGAAANFAPYETRAFQRPDVLRSGSERYVEGTGEFADAARP